MQTLPCALCNQPMRVVDGMLVYAHKECRKQARKVGLRDAIKSSRERYALEQRLASSQSVI
jgi:hypothetical protein